MYSDILIPTDGTDAVTPAIGHALDLTKTFGATLHTLYVVDEDSYPTLDARVEVLAETLESEGEQAVEEIRERAETVGVSATTVVVRGSPYREILDYADEHGVDLIVMGTHGRRGLDRYLLGSVTEKVVRSTAVPVLTIRSPGVTEE